MAIIEFDTGDAGLVAEEAGTGARTFVLLHGIGMGRTIYGDLIEQLGDAHTIAIDLPGYGAAPEPGRTPTIEQMADIVATFLRTRERVGAEMVLVGHSMGTQVATEIAARHPDLVDRLVLAAPTVNVRERTAARQARRLAQDLADESPRVLLRGGREYLRAGPNLRDKMRAMLAHRPEDAYPRITAPTLVLRGEHDCVCPRDWYDEVVRLLPHARLAEIEGHGHETLIKDAAPAAAEIRSFLDTT